MSEKETVVSTKDEKEPDEVKTDNNSASKPAAKKPKTTGTTKKKKKTSKNPPLTHPHYKDMIKDALSSLKERSGTSRQAILKYIMSNYTINVDEKAANNHLKMSLRAGVKNGSLTQSKGQGASGSFKLGNCKSKKKSKTDSKKENTPRKMKKEIKIKPPKRFKKVKPSKAKKTKSVKKQKSSKKKAVKKDVSGEVISEESAKEV